LNFIVNGDAAVPRRSCTQSFALTFYDPAGFTRSGIYQEQPIFNG
jgi:hypothetical protein